MLSKRLPIFIFSANFNKSKNHKQNITNLNKAASTIDTKSSGAILFYSDIHLFSNILEDINTGIYVITSGRVCAGREHEYDGREGVRLAVQRGEVRRLRLHETRAQAYHYIVLYYKQL